MSELYCNEPADLDYCLKFVSCGQIIGTSLSSIMAEGEMDVDVCDSEAPTANGGLPEKSMPVVPGVAANESFFPTSAAWLQVRISGLIYTL